MHAAVAAMSMNTEAAHETPSCCRHHRPTSLFVPPEFAQDHGDLLLAVLRSRDLGIHYPLPRKVSASSARVRDLFSWSLDPLGHAVSLAAGHHHFIPRRTVGQELD